jgi:hypothetical protein
MTKVKNKYLWSWAAAGVAVPLLLLLIGSLMPKPPEWNPFQEPSISPAQKKFATVGALLWPTIPVTGVLGLAFTDSGGDASAPLPATIIIAVSILLNAAIYVGIGFAFWFLGQTFVSFSKNLSSP